MNVSKKVFATIPDELAERLESRAKKEGRTVSDLISYLCEKGMDEWAERILKEKESKVEL